MKLAEQHLEFNPLKEINIYLDKDVLEQKDPIKLFKWMCEKVFKKRIIGGSPHLDTFFKKLNIFLDIEMNDLNDYCSKELSKYTDIIRTVFSPSCFENEYLRLGKFEDIEKVIEIEKLNNVRDVSFFRLEQVIISQNYLGMFTHYFDQTIPFNIFYFDKPFPFSKQNTYLIDFVSNVRESCRECANESGESLGYIKSKYNMYLYKRLSRVYPLYVRLEKEKIEYRNSLIVKKEGAAEGGAEGADEGAAEAKEGVAEDYNLPRPSLAKESIDVEAVNYFYVNSLLTSESLASLLKFLLNNKFVVDKGEPSNDTNNYEDDHLEAIKKPGWLLDKDLKIPEVQYV